MMNAPMNDPINVLLLVNFSDELVNKLKSVSPRLRIHRLPTRSPRDVPDSLWATTEILYTANVLPEPDVALRLRWVQLHFAGADAVMDSPLLQNESVIVTSASGVHASTMAEYSFAMILALARKIPTMLRLQKKAEWPENRFELLMPTELRDATLGIVGYGSIGRATARLAKAFGMTVLASKRDVMRPASANEWEEIGVGDPDATCVDRLYPPEAIKSMLSECDFVVVTVPLTPHTHKMINADVLAAMKRTAYLINVGRGGVVDEPALVAALQNGTIAGAALDVFAQEPLPQSSPLWGMENVIISPHLAGNHLRYNERAADLFAQNLERYLEKRDLLNRVSITRGY
jgi:phosphoglycerate dehydrogenase-like enzyme